MKSKVGIKKSVLAELSVDEREAVHKFWRLERQHYRKIATPSRSYRGRQRKISVSSGSS